MRKERKKKDKHGYGKTSLDGLIHVISEFQKKDKFRSSMDSDTKARGRYYWKRFCDAFQTCHKFKGRIFQNDLGGIYYLYDRFSALLTFDPFAIGNKWFLEVYYFDMDLLFVFNNEECSQLGKQPRNETWNRACWYLEHNIRHDSYMDVA